MSDTNNINENKPKPAEPYTPSSEPHPTSQPEQETGSPESLRSEQIPYGTNTVHPDHTNTSQTHTETGHSLYGPKPTPQTQPQTSHQPYQGQHQNQQTAPPMPDQPYNYPTHPNQTPYSNAVYGDSPTYANQGYNYAPARAYNKMAIASLSLGASQIVLFWLVIPAFLAVIFGHISLNQINKTGEQGKGLAITGLILGYIGVVFTLFWLVLILGISAGSVSSY